jgi:hypothetical protein
MTVEQAETHLRVVVPIEEEEVGEYKTFHNKRCSFALQSKNITTCCSAVLTVLSLTCMSL